MNISWGLLLDSVIIRHKNAHECKSSSLDWMFVHFINIFNNDLENDLLSLRFRCSPERAVE